MSYVFAIYGRRRVIIVSITVFYAVTLLSNVILGALGIIWSRSKGRETDVTSTCSVNSPEYTLTWTPSFVFDICLFILVAKKSMANYFKSPDRTWTGAQLMKVLGRDCLVFYLWNAVASVTQTAARANWPANYNQIGATWMFAVQPMIINHLVIHMNVQFMRGGLSWNDDQ